MPFFDPGVKYELLRLVVTLWVTFIVLVFMLRRKLPSKVAHNVINILLAIAAVVQFVAIVFISLTMSF